MNPTPVLEKNIQSACVTLLQLDGWRPLKTDPVSRREWGKGFGEPGMADHLFIRYSPRASSKPLSTSERTAGCASYAQIIWVEFKRVRGKNERATKAAANQKTWHRDERLRGALTLIAGEDFPATIDGFLGWYRNSGLMKRHI